MKRILIAEDNQMNRRLLRDVLAYYGYEIVEAENGQVAVEKAKQQPPDLIFFDIQMPVMNGYDAIKILRDMPATKHIKVIAMTSFAMAGDKEEIMAAGFDEYISKPIDTRKLSEMVKGYLEG